MAATDDSIPALIGPKSNQYVLDRTQLLGDGHSGQVYAGWKVNDTDVQVAIKLDKTSGAKHEWAMLKKMEGRGVPRVHLTCVSGKWHVCVMDRLGPTLATWADAMRYKHAHTFVREQVSAVSRKLLRLLQGLHEKGDIHGDVKPENFLVPYRPAADGQATATVGTIDMRQDDPVMVDLGFSSAWRKRPGGGEDCEECGEGSSGAHIDYSQALGQFHGTTRYASLHCHAGRTLARRDDLESLAYTVLYLLQGRLPWQGQEGADKEQRDQKMRYLLTYVRQLPFHEEPDYEFLDHCLNFGGYNYIGPWLARLKAISGPFTTDGVPAQHDDDGGGCTGAGADAPAAAAGAGAGDVVHAVGGKRKRVARGEDAEGDEGEGGADGSDGAGADGAPVAKRVRIELPQEAARAFMWFVISVNPLEGREAFSSHTTYHNLITKVNEFWKQGLWIKHICFDGSLYTALFNSNQKYAQQTVSHQTSLEDLKRFIKEYWNKGYYVTSLARDAVGWGIVVTKFQPYHAYYKQSYCVSCMIPINWIKQKWQRDFFITCCAFSDEPQLASVVIMSKGEPYSSQKVEVDFKYPSEVIHKHWDAGYIITNVASWQDQNVFVLSKPKGSTFLTQVSTRTRDYKKEIKSAWDNNRSMATLGFCRVT
ncbi:hypothetical protein KFE25_014311 [Diacronema lutheri]|uniref:Protein kinase domain-containing protein n=1 Tax=Diacronema lutheri TaxID=2081491 RepID=A0A8J5X3Q3_DIALT|nr:hypothetical protein KFE25_014311 [Diacronema lutheri]